MFAPVDISPLVPTALFSIIFKHPTRNQFSNQVIFFYVTPIKPFCSGLRLWDLYLPGHSNLDSISPPVIYQYRWVIPSLQDLDTSLSSVFSPAPSWVSCARNYWNTAGCVGWLAHRASGRHVGTCVRWAQIPQILWIFSARCQGQLFCVWRLLWETKQID